MYFLFFVYNMQLLGFLHIGGPFSVSACLFDWVLLGMCSAGTLVFLCISGSSWFQLGVCTMVKYWHVR